MSSSIAGYQNQKTIVRKLTKTLDQEKNYRTKKTALHVRQLRNNEVETSRNKGNYSNSEMVKQFSNNQKNSKKRNC